jgi:hypothetical protein
VGGPVGRPTGGPLRQTPPPHLVGPCLDRHANAEDGPLIGAQEKPDGARISRRRPLSKGFSCQHHQRPGDAHADHHDEEDDEEDHFGPGSADGSGPAKVRPEGDASVALMNLLLGPLLEQALNG